MRSEKPCVIARILCGAGCASVPFSSPSKEGMERWEAPGAGEAPLGGPCDRPACAPCEGARPRSKRGLRLPALHLQSSWRSLRKLDCAMRVIGAPRPVPPSNVTRDDALCEQGALNIRAVWRARISYFERSML